MHSLTQLLTRVSTRSLLYALAHAFTHSCTHSLMYTLIHVRTHSCTHSFTHALNHAPTHSRTYSHTLSRMKSLAHARVYGVQFHTPTTPLGLTHPSTRSSSSARHANGPWASLDTRRGTGERTRASTGVLPPRRSKSTRTPVEFERGGRTVRNRRRRRSGSCVGKENLYLFEYVFIYVGRVINTDEKR